MNNIKFEYKILVIITAIGYSFNFLFALLGVLFPDVSHNQLLCFQMGDASAIMASVLAARYVGLRGQHIAASAFTLLGITHGLSLASSGLENFNVEKGITVIIPMVPSLILLFWCTLFPTWLRALALLPMFMFLFVYINVINGGIYYSAPVIIAYSSWIFLEILWSAYIYKDWKKAVAIST